MNRRTLDDFIGNEPEKNELKQIIDFTFLYNASLRENPAAPFPNRIFLYGPPGTGKSYLCRLLIDYFFETSTKYDIPVEVIYIDSSFKDKYYGESERKLREKLSKFNNFDKITMMVIDEIDTLFSSRTFFENQTDASILGELLKSLEGILVENNYNNILLTTTNAPEKLDPALIDRIANKSIFINGFVNKKQYAELLDKTLKLYGLDYKLLNLSQEDVDFFSQWCYEKKLTPRKTKRIIDEFLFQIKNRNYNLNLEDYILKDPYTVRRKLYSNKEINIKELMSASFERTKDF
ncbi:MAG: vacuolar proteinsorting-associated protein 4 [Candidatus Woesearchaeota archaeon]|nr:vacuolar proteinsorting-associated protein 4 [Candidatus Woesearchaeota archaeon]MDN5327445.1 vacuolar proteinsorting-associated protein 4 [Candidatus Woesearchaeota archaeon]